MLCDHADEALATIGRSLSVGIDSLWIRGFRCVEDARITLAGDEVWLVGPNASGKTSFLEAIYLLFRGHSFLSARHGPLVSAGSDVASIECRIRAEGDKKIRLSCLIKGRSCRARIDDSDISAQALSERIGSVRFFGGNAQELIAGEPRMRRGFVDWNLFHVEPSYRSVSMKYARVLQQRNAALKARAQPVAIWEADLVELSEQIAAHRESYLTKIATEICVIGTRFFGDRSLNLTWSHGWPTNLGMAEALRKNLDSDRRRGFTQCGAHRFTASLSIGPTLTPGSRGEQKMLAAIFQMACENVHVQSGGQPSTWLIDDAFSELTQDNGALLIDSLRTFGGQTFFTAMREPSEMLLSQCPDRLVFHVEHGSFHDAAMISKGTAFGHE